MADPTTLMVRRLRHHFEGLFRSLPRFGQGSVTVPAGFTGADTFDVPFDDGRMPNGYQVVADVNGADANQLTATVIRRRSEGVRVRVRNTGTATTEPAAVSVLAFAVRHGGPESEEDFNG